MTLLTFICYTVRGLVSSVSKSWSRHHIELSFPISNVDDLIISSYYVFSLQAVLDASIFPTLIDILKQAEFKTRKEAAWAITNATSGGSHAQIK